MKEFLHIRNYALNTIPSIAENKKNATQTSEVLDKEHNDLIRHILSVVKNENNPKKIKICYRLLKVILGKTENHYYEKSHPASKFILANKIFRYHSRAAALQAGAECSNELIKILKLQKTLISCIKFFDAKKNMSTAEFTFASNLKVVLEELNAIINQTGIYKGLMGYKQWFEVNKAFIEDVNNIIEKIKIPVNLDEKKILIDQKTNDFFKSTLREIMQASTSNLAWETFFETGEHKTYKLEEQTNISLNSYHKNLLEKICNKSNVSEFKESLGTLRKTFKRKFNDFEEKRKKSLKTKSISISKYEQLLREAQKDDEIQKILSHYPHIKRKLSESTGIDRAPFLEDSLYTLLKEIKCYKTKYKFQLQLEMRKPSKAVMAILQADDKNAQNLLDPSNPLLDLSWLQLYSAFYHLPFASELQARLKLKIQFFIKEILSQTSKQKLKLDDKTAEILKRSLQCILTSLIKANKLQIDEGILFNAKNNEVTTLDKVINFIEKSNSKDQTLLNLRSIVTNLLTDTQAQDINYITSDDISVPVLNHLLNAKLKQDYIHLNPEEHYQLYWKYHNKLEARKQSHYTDSKTFFHNLYSSICHLTLAAHGNNDNAKSRLKLSQKIATLDLASQIEETHIRALKNILQDSPHFGVAKTNLFLLYYGRRYTTLYSDYNARLLDLEDAFRHLSFTDKRYNGLKNNICQILLGKKYDNCIELDIHTLAKTTILLEISGFDPLARLLNIKNDATSPYPFKILSDSQLYDFTRQILKPNSELESVKFLSTVITFRDKALTEKIKSIKMSNKDAYSISLSKKDLAGPIIFTDALTGFEIGRVSIINSKFKFIGFNKKFNIQLLGCDDIEHFHFDNDGGSVHFQTGIVSSKSVTVIGKTTLDFDGTIHAKNNISFDISGQLSLCSESKIKSAQSISVKSDACINQGKMIANDFLTLQIDKNLQIKDDGTCYAGNNLNIEANSFISNSYIGSNARINVRTRDSIYLNAAKLDGKQGINIRAKSLMSNRSTTVVSDSAIRMELDEKWLNQKDTTWVAESLQVTSKVIKNYSAGMQFDTAQINNTECFTNYATGSFKTTKSFVVTGENFWNSGKINFGDNFIVRLNKFYVNGIIKLKELNDYFSHLWETSGSCIEGKQATVLCGAYLNVCSQKKLRSFALTTLAELNVGVTLSNSTNVSSLLALNVGVNLPNAMEIYKDLRSFINLVQDGKTNEALDMLSSADIAYKSASAARWLLQTFLPKLGKPINLTWTFMLAIMNTPSLISQLNSLYKQHQNGNEIQPYQYYNLLNIAFSTINQGLSIHSQIENLKTGLGTGTIDNVNWFNSIALNLATLFMPMDNETSLISANIGNFDLTYSSQMQSAFSFSRWNVQMAMTISNMFYDAYQQNTVDIAYMRSVTANTYDHNGDVLANSNFMFVNNYEESGKTNAVVENIQGKQVHFTQESSTTSTSENIQSQNLSLEGKTQTQQLAAHASDKMHVSNTLEIKKQASLSANKLTLDAQVTLDEKTNASDSDPAFYANANKIIATPDSKIEGADTDAVMKATQSIKLEGSEHVQNLFLDAEDKNGNIGNIKLDGTITAEKTLSAKASNAIHQHGTNESETQAYQAHKVNLDGTERIIPTTHTPKSTINDNPTNDTTSTQSKPPAKEHKGINPSLYVKSDEFTTGKNNNIDAVHSDAAFDIGDGRFNGESHIKTLIANADTHMEFNNEDAIKKAYLDVKTGSLLLNDVLEGKQLTAIASDTITENKAITIEKEILKAHDIQLNNDTTVNPALKNLKQANRLDTMAPLTPATPDSNSTDMQDLTGAKNPKTPNVYMNATTVETSAQSQINNPHGSVFIDTTSASIGGQNNIEHLDIKATSSITIDGITHLKSGNFEAPNMSVSGQLILDKESPARLSPSNPPIAVPPGPSYNPRLEPTSPVVDSQPNGSVPMSNLTHAKKPKPADIDIKTDDFMASSTSNIDAHGGRLVIDSTVSHLDGQLNARELYFNGVSTELSNKVTMGKGYFYSSGNVEDNAQVTFNNTVKNPVFAVSTSDFDMSKVGSFSGRGTVTINAHAAELTSINVSDLALTLDHVQSLDDLIMHRGIYAGINVTDSLSINTQDAITLNENLDLNYSLALVGTTISLASNVHSTGNLSFTSTVGDITTTNDTVIADGILNLNSASNYTNTRGQICGGVEYIHAKNNVTNFAGSICSPIYLQVITDNGTIKNICDQVTVKGPYGPKQLYTAAQLTGGSGYGFGGVGLNMESGDQIINDGSNICSIGSNYLQAKNGISTTGRADVWTSDHREWHNPWSDKETTVFSTQIQPSLIYSAKGSNTIISQQGGINSLSTTFSAQTGNTLSAKGNITLTGFIARDICKKDDSFGFGIFEDNSKLTTEFPVPTAVVGPGDIKINSLSDILLENSILITPGNVSLSGVNVKVSAPILTNTFKENSFLPSLVLPGLSSIPGYTNYQDMNNLFNSNGSGQFAENLWNTSLNAINLMNNAISAYSTGNITNVFCPSVGVDFTHTSETMTSQSVANNVGIEAGSLNITGTNSVSFVDGVPVLVSGDAVVATPEFIEKGAKLYNSCDSASEGVTVAVDLNAKPSLSGHFSVSHSEQATYANQLFSVGGKLTVAAAEWYMTAANVQASAIEGAVGYLSIASPLNTSSGYSASGQVSTTGSCGFNFEKDRSGWIGTRSGITITGSINAPGGPQFAAGYTSLKAAGIIAQGTNNFCSGTIEATMEKEYTENESFGINGNISSFTGGKTCPPSIPIFDVSVSMKSYRAQQFATLFGNSGTNPNIGRISGSLNTANANGLHVSRDINFSANVEVPLLCQQTIAGTKNNLQWFGNKLNPQPQQPPSPPSVNDQSTHRAVTEDPQRKFAQEEALDEAVINMQVNDPTLPINKVTNDDVRDPGSIKNTDWNADQSQAPSTTVNSGELSLPSAGINTQDPGFMHQMREEIGDLNRQKLPELMEQSSSSADMNDDNLFAPLPTPTLTISNRSKMQLDPLSEVFGTARPTDESWFNSYLPNQDGGQRPGIFSSNLNLLNRGLERDPLDIAAATDVYTYRSTYQYLMSLDSRMPQPQVVTTWDQLKYVYDHPGQVWNQFAYDMGHPTLSNSDSLGWQVVDFINRGAIEDNNNLQIAINSGNPIYVAEAVAKPILTAWIADGVFTLAAPYIAPFTDSLISSFGGGQYSVEYGMNAVSNTVMYLTKGSSAILSRFGIFGGESVVNWASHNVADASRLRTTYALQEAGILDESGRLTEAAIENSRRAISKNSVINNNSVVQTLTRDGSKITDWTKKTTESIPLPNGQRIQVHYYQNTVTGKIDYIHSDFKVKGVVNDLIYPSNRTMYEPKTVQDIFDKLDNRFKL